MLDVIEKYFPELPDRIRNLRLGWKVLAVSLILSLPLLWSQARPVMDVMRAALGFEFRTSVGLLLGVACGCCVVGFLLRSLADRRVARGRLVEFCKTWIAFSDNLTLIACYADGDRIRRDRGEPAKYDDDLMLRLVEHWKYRERLCLLFYQLGEDALNPRHNHDWAEMVAASPQASKRGYKTPFSFFLDLRNPIAAHNRDSLVWHGLQVAGDYLDYLEYKHRFLERALRGLRPHAAGIEAGWRNATAAAAAAKRVLVQS